MYKTEKGVKVKLNNFLDLLKDKNCPVRYVSGFEIYSKTKTLFECELHGNFEAIPHLVIKKDGHGCPSCTELQKRKSICGVGINDVLNYDRLDYYLWYNVIRRGSMEYGSYKNVTFSEDWVLFSNFLRDLPDIDNYKMRKIKGWHLDKDLFSGEHKIYSKETVCFLPDEINNSLAVGSNGSKNRGAIFDPEIGKYFALVMLDGRRRRFGSFKTREEAHEKYKEVKLLEIIRLAEKYKDSLSSRCYNALLNWVYY